MVAAILHLKLPLPVIAALAPKATHCESVSMQTLKNTPI
jgi:hypothetical protein